MLLYLHVHVYKIKGAGKLESVMQQILQNKYFPLFHNIRYLTFLDIYYHCSVYLSI